MPDEKALTPETLLCPDGEPHEWHTAEGGLSCTECDLFLMRREFSQRHDRLEKALSADRKRIGALDALRPLLISALSETTKISIAVDLVMAEWANQMPAELVPTTVGQWAERAAEAIRTALAALRGE